MKERLRKHAENVLMRTQTLGVRKPSGAGMKIATSAAEEITMLQEIYLSGNSAFKTPTLFLATWEILSSSLFWRYRIH